MSYTRSTKRQFQPSISDYFSPSAALISNTHATQPLNRVYAEAITLPEHVQANLLSVGMRIRKAVPEGYKNIDAPIIPRSATPRLATDFTPAPSVPRPAPRPLELAPFCGIHKTGGYLSTSYRTPSPTPPSMSMPINYNEDGYFPSSSQESFASTYSIADEDSRNVVVPMPQMGNTNTRKRGMADEFDDDVEAQADCAGRDVTFDPAFFDARLFGMLEAGGGVSVVPERIIARPVTRRARIAVDDFDEAAFLQPGAGHDVDMQD